MNISLIIFLSVVLLTLIVGYNLLLQYKVRVESNRRQQFARYIAIIDTTEDLINNAHHLPFSQDLLICLNSRILAALEHMFMLDPKNKQLAQRIKNMNTQLETLKSAPVNSENTTFKAPSNDKQAIVMLKLVKRLKETIRNEHNKGNFNTQDYIAENNRLEAIQLRINIENVVKRANDAVTRKQIGTAHQLITKALDVLANKSDPYSSNARKKLKSMLSELAKTKKIKDTHAKPNVEEEKDEHNNDMEAIFGEKKKWW